MSALVTRSMPVRTPPSRTAAVVPITKRANAALTRPLPVNSVKKRPMSSGLPVTAPVATNQT